MAASSSPHVVPVPMSRADAVDPEEAFVASLSSCHMLTFLWIAARRGFVVEGYHDEAVGVLSKDAGGQLAMTSVVLRPRVTFAGDRTPEAETHEAMHHEARRPVLHREVREDRRTLRAGRGGRLTGELARTPGPILRILSRVIPARGPASPLRSVDHHPPRRAADDSTT